MESIQEQAEEEHPESVEVERELNSLLETTLRLEHELRMAVQQ